MKKIIFMAALCLVAASVSAQKKNVSYALSEANAEKPNFKEAEPLIKEALSNPETKEDAKTYYAAGLLQYKRFEIERNKLYIGQNDKVDNNVMYTSLNAYANYFNEATTYDMRPNDKGKVRPKYTKEMAQKVTENRPMLVNGFAYYYQDAKKYDQAYNLINTYVESAKWAMFNGKDMISTDSTYSEMKYYRALAAYMMKDYPKAITAFVDLKDDNYKPSEIYQTLHGLYIELKDSVNAQKIIEEGVVKFPQDSYYLSNMIDSYIRKGDHAAAIKYLDQAIALDPTKAVYYSVKGRLLAESGNLDESLKMFHKVVEVEPNNADEQFNLGAIYYEKARLMRDNCKDNREYQQRKAEINAAFELSLPYLEKAREIDPQKRFLYFLRNVYDQLGSQKINEINQLLGE